MADMTRAELTRRVYSRLRQDEFRSRLAAVSPCGRRPVLIALRDDPVQQLLDQVRDVGGSANVVLPLLNGFIVLLIVAEHRLDDGPPPPGVSLLRGDCTVGVFYERLRFDASVGGPTSYGFVLEAETGGASEVGRAELVALGD